MDELAILCLSYRRKVYGVHQISTAIEGASAHTLQYVGLPVPLGAEGLERGVCSE